MTSWIFTLDMKISTLRITCYVIFSDSERSPSCQQMCWNWNLSDTSANYSWDTKRLLKSVRQPHLYISTRSCRVVQIRTGYQRVHWSCILLEKNEYKRVQIWWINCVRYWLSFYSNQYYLSRISPTKNNISWMKIRYEMIKF